MLGRNRRNFSKLTYWLIIISCSTITATSPSQADPLGTVPSLEPERTKIIFEGRSDLWTSPYMDKDSPLRFYSNKLLIPILRQAQWEGSINLQMDGISLGDRIS